MQQLQAYDSRYSKYSIISICINISFASGKKIVPDYQFFSNWLLTMMILPATSAGKEWLQNYSKLATPVLCQIRKPIIKQ